MSNSFLPVLERELEAWSGVVFSLDDKRSHPRIVLTYNGASRFVVTSRSPSDYRVDRNRIKTVRHVLSELGAKRAR
ncbi:hypothetical protein UFOVP4_49 [uncultured Caudovirales phage]|uniref:Uncharacterized protein n=1 Tax=uncultured Caudovirales phage TaxID=2100421 RepID=A0A6J7VJE1_9CAUD|nr:hypothetical protein UFOVP4_49 [uncultured Caudovirales phage]CAB4241243.1 hypothetical protein UFOVP64_11 [uncultured Caudovirales phage]CAB5078984.1 hypothetical protein UFOVP145_25 [uncultured Caudovirales phage]